MPATAPAIADLLIHARWVIPVTAGDPVLDHHSVVVRDGRIVDLLPQADARQRWSARETITLPTHALIPGLVNLHVHAAMTLMRGLADDLPLMEWLETAIWPAEARHISFDFVRAGSQIAAAEMLRGGITTCNEMYFYPEAAAEAFHTAGLRAMVGIIAVESPTPYAADPDAYLRQGLAARETWHAPPQLGFALAPHAPYTVSDSTFERIAALAAELDCPIHIHVHESAPEVSDAIARTGERPLARLARLGLLSQQFIGVHAVHVNELDLELLARHNCSVAHCPSSNMKLASGIAPVTQMLKAGINIGLGTDGAASNNRLDLFEEMRQAALLAKVASGDATTVPAHTALRMATLNGARALGWDDHIGSIETGKLADLCAVDLNSIETRPCFDPVSHLVYVAGRQHVSHVWTGGCLRIRDGEAMLQNSNSELIGLSSLWQTRIKS